MSNTSIATPSIHIIGASAGTGKTTRLATEYIRRIEGADGNPPVAPTRMIVCTFTNKAADELSARIRQRLHQMGKADEAQLVLAGYVGTVNSICGRLLKDYALECGLSPDQDVVPEHMQANLFAIASATVLDAYAQSIDDMARRLSFTETTSKSVFQKRTHWMDQVRTICTLARANGMTPAALRESSARSWRGMQRHLGHLSPNVNLDELDELIASALENAIVNIDKSSDATEGTAKALQTLRECFARARNGSMTWRDWAAVKKLTIGAKSKDDVSDLITVCKILNHHPRLHSDLKTYLHAIFECAAECLEAYQAYKSANGLVDFVDQEYLALQALDNPKVRQSLSSRLDLVLIDEFQDTSPIQLALFIKLAELAKHSIWVGDVKQAIYGFRGTDPQLMQRASELFVKQKPLGESYRSCPELISFSNEIFRRVFPPLGINELDVVIQPSGNRPGSQSHALEYWSCSGKELKECFASLAAAVRNFLTDNEAIQIDDPESGIRRPVRGSDIALLCRKNDHCSSLATALSGAGLKVAMMRAGLLESPECVLAIATLRYLADASDKMALGQIVHLTQDYSEGPTASTPSDWLGAWIAAGRNPERLISHKEILDSVRKRLPACTIGDALNKAIDAGRLLEMIEGWGNVPERLSNLDSLRGLVLEYEDTCALARIPATINGFLCYLEDLDEADQPASQDVDAVRILTYHGSKGLEWPVVVLCDLDAEAAPKVHKDLCKIYVESADAPFDVNDPLAGRWIRFWPWPFGAIEKDGDFETNAANSPEFESTINRVRAENMRLMYVGMTRARDMLVMAPYSGRTLNPKGTQWLDELSIEGSPVMQLPDSVGHKQLLVGDSEHRVRIRQFAGSIESAAQDKLQNRIEVYDPLNERKSSPRETYFLRPSSITTALSLSSGTSASSGTSESSATPGAPPIYDRRLLATGSISQISLSSTVIDLGERIMINGKVDMSRLGECVHSFLAVDDAEADKTERLKKANEICKIWQITQITDEDLLLMSTRLSRFLSSQFAGQEIQSYNECPISARVEQQRIRGVVDLLIESSNAFTIIDHKTFPGPMEQWESKALSFAPQLEAYKKALELTDSGKKVSALYIHMPIVGKIIELMYPECSSGK